MPNSTLTRVRRVRVGHATDRASSTGVTAVVFERAAPTVVDVRGGASCTYDTSSLTLDATFGRRWAVFFAGGSVYGLDAGRGVRNFLVERGAGHAAFSNPNPIVPITGATLFDLPDTKADLPDYTPLGHAAARSADRSPVAEGRVGAATGARVGKYLGRERSTHGSLGSACARLSGGGAVGALVVLNAIGAVRDPSTGEWVAGARGPDGRILPPTDSFRGATSRTADARGTTLVAVVTDAPVERRTLARVATYAHTGLARAIEPVHSTTDGDVVFASTTYETDRPVKEGSPGATADALGHLAARLVVEAVLRAVRAHPT